MMSRRKAVQLALGGATASVSACRQNGAGLGDFVSYAEMLRQEDRDAMEIRKHFFDRIERLDCAGLGIRAVIELNPDSTVPRSGKLRGLPVLLKDNIETADGMKTTAGSRALVNSVPKRDAYIVKRLREAGMLLLGKTNLSEWANLRSPKSTSGWSARGGLTRNPHRLTHSASGSSSGSAAAVAAGFTPGAIGTETNGSIVSPASACGIVGFKPTLGMVSRSGIIPITHWQDTAGSMTRSVYDAALLMNVIAGSDPEDVFTNEADKRRPADFTERLHSDGLKGKRLGVVRSMCGSDAEVLRLFDQAVQALRDARADVIDNVDLPNAEKLGRLSMMAMLVEFRQDLNAYLEHRQGEVRSMAELIAFNEAHKAEEMPHFGQEFLEQADKLGTPEIVEAGRQARVEVRRLAREQGIDAALQAHHLDALICPTNDPTKPIDLAHGDADVRVASTPAAVAGYPHLTVPMGFVDYLPVGLSFIGTAWTDAAILGMGHAFERVTQAIRAPAS